MKTHTTQTKAVTPKHEGWTPHERQYRNFLPS